VTCVMSFAEILAHHQNALNPIDVPIDSNPLRQYTRFFGSVICLLELTLLIQFFPFGSEGGIIRPLLCLPGLSRQPYPGNHGRGDSYASVENKSMDALSDSENLHRAAKSTTTVANGKLQP